MRILHGDNVQASRNELVRLKEEFAKKGMGIVGLSSKTMDIATVKQVVESGSLFGADQVLVLEELFSGSKSKAKEEVTAYLKENKPENVLIWEGKKIDGRKISGWQGVEKEEFKVDSVVFKFLEEVRPGNQKNILRLYGDLLNTNPIELVFFMIVRQVRQLIEVVSDEGGFRGPPWLKSKLKGQASAFGLKGLLELHKMLYLIEVEHKTGKNSLPLEVKIELLLMSL